MRTRTKLIVMAAATVLLATAATGYIRIAASRAAQPVATGAVSLREPGRILFRSTAPDSLGHLAAVSAADPAGPRTVSELSCNRVYAAAGTGICLRPDGLLPTYQLVWLDAELHHRAEIPIVGVPNRARVSPSGRLLAWTAFVQGDSYNGGRFSTRTGLLDPATGTEYDLEQFTILLDGAPYRSVDVNFWGITAAADDDRFYATLDTGGRRYLVEGSLRTRTVRTLAANVECPSLSPDGTRLGFKEAVGGDPARGWRVTVLDLATLARTPLAETRSVDDQVVWLDDRTIGYAIVREHGSDVWAVPADGTGRARLLVPDAESPAPLR
ncbi:TolB-like translocation protein; signal peptide [Catellatospora sp. TT07R-123]|uniref:hypothetical protein n=1 Tax=Catellatospora sp. TT07R-123 TaxID=2733863 RepID=UPI001B22F9DD|nr:hypothetical protein [Catellatospora sp. TT07R-123]GHJ48899.1 TolB-like translocation protein; signal peptide [Catellatospora sp. TT07R-123]